MIDYVYNINKQMGETSTKEIKYQECSSTEDKENLSIEENNSMEIKNLDPKYVCKKKHTLWWSVNSKNYPSEIFICDVCHESQKCSVGRWHCVPCSYDVCFHCRNPKNN